MTRNARSPKLTVERLSSDEIEVHELLRAPTLQTVRMSVRPSFKWPHISRLTVNRFEIELEVSQIRQRIRVSWSSCFLGGQRPWLHCPYCEARKAILLRGLGGYFCRSCPGNPSYASQSKSAHGRRHFEICKIRLLLGGMASLKEPFPDRPRGMHRKKYNRMKARALELETELLPPRHRGKSVDYRNLAYYLS